MKDMHKRRGRDEKRSRGSEAFVEEFLEARLIRDGSDGPRKKVMSWVGDEGGGANRVMMPIGDLGLMGRARGRLGVSDRALEEVRGAP